MEVHPPARLRQAPQRAPPCPAALVVGVVRQVDDARSKEGTGHFTDLDRRLRRNRAGARHGEDRLHVPPAPRSADLGELRIQQLQDTGRRSPHLRVKKPQLPIDGCLYGLLTLVRHTGTLRSCLPRQCLGARVCRDLTGPAPSCDGGDVGGRGIQRTHGRKDMGRAATQAFSRAPPGQLPVRFSRMHTQAVLRAQRPRQPQTLGDGLLCGIGDDRQRVVGVVRRVRVQAIAVPLAVGQSDVDVLRFVRFIGRKDQQLEGSCSGRVTARSRLRRARAWSHMGYSPGRARRGSGWSESACMGTILRHTAAAPSHTTSQQRPARAVVSCGMIGRMMEPSARKGGLRPAR